MLFGLIGALVLGLGFGSGLNLIYLWRQGTLNPNRPLVSLTVILLVAGLQIILFGFLGSQIVQVRRELYRTQKAIKLQGMHRAPDAAHDSPAPHAAHPRQSTEPHSVERAAG
jgi:predicted PurR-regulated permease PerM